MAKNFNDPFEMKPPMVLYDNDQSMCAAFEALMPQVVEEEYAKLAPELRSTINPERFQSLMIEIVKKQLPIMIPAWRELEPLLSSSLHERIHSITGILCLTESNDNLLMWAHYGMSHTGYVVGFDASHHFFNRRRTEFDEFYHVRQVRYSDERPRMVLSQAEDLSAFLTKSQHWAYEREWRMLIPLSAANEVLDDGTKHYHLFDYPVECVQSIYLGCRISQSDRAKILDLISRDKEFHHVQCYQAEINYRYFRLDFVSIGL